MFKKLKNLIVRKQEEKYNKYNTDYPHIRQVYKELQAKEIIEFKQNCIKSFL